MIATDLLFPLIPSLFGSNGDEGEDGNGEGGGEATEIHKTKCLSLDQDADEIGDNENEDHRNIGVAVNGSG